MRFVAFIRNINVGQARFPGKEPVLQSFLAAGARAATSFQSNGTVVVDVDGGMDRMAYQAAARESLQRLCRFTEPVFVRELAVIQAAVALDPFKAVARVGFIHRYVSYFDPGHVSLERFPLESPKQDCLIFMASGEEAYSIACEIKGVSGYPTPLLEKTFQTPVTTRSWTTLQRLAVKFAV